MLFNTTPPWKHAVCVCGWVDGSGLGSGGTWATPAGRGPPLPLPCWAQGVWVLLLPSSCPACPAPACSLPHPRLPCCSARPPARRRSCTAPLLCCAIASLALRCVARAPPAAPPFTAHGTPVPTPPALALPAAGVSSHACKACTPRVAATPGHTGRHGSAGSCSHSGQARQRWLLQPLRAGTAALALAATQGRHGCAGSCSHSGQARQRWLLQPLGAGTASRRRQPRSAGTQHGVSMGEVVLNNTSWGCF